MLFFIYIVCVLYLYVFFALHIWRIINYLSIYLSIMVCVCGTKLCMPVKVLLLSNERGQTNLPVFFSNCSQSISQCRRKINTVTWILTVSVHRKIYCLSS